MKIVEEKSGGDNKRREEQDSERKDEARSTVVWQKTEWEFLLPHKKPESGWGPSSYISRFKFIPRASERQYVKPGISSPVILYFICHARGMRAA